MYSCKSQAACPCNSPFKLEDNKLASQALPLLMLVYSLVLFWSSEEAVYCRVFSATVNT